MPQPTADELAQLGLTSYEAKAYLALIRRGSSTGSEVARVGELPRQRVYDVLASLVEKGLATTRPGSPARYAATPPELAHEANRMIAGLAPAYEAGQSHSNPLEYVEVLRDRAAIAKRFDELQAAVEREILVFTKPPYATPPEENVEG